MVLDIFDTLLRARKGPGLSMVPGGRAARRGNGVTHVWNEPSRAVYDRTYRVLFDAGLNEELADELATQRTLAAAFRRARNYMRTSLLPHCFQANAMWKHDGASHQKGCSYQVFNGAPERIRTADPQIRSLVLYPAELRALDSAAGNRPAGRGIAIVLTAYWQELRRELSRRLRGPGQGLVFDTDSI